jgi:hypothetical protein
MRLYFSARTILMCAVLQFPCCSLLVAERAPLKCDWAAFERDAAAMRTAREAAMKVAVQDIQTDVPPETIGQIQAFKNGLDGAYKEFFLCQPPLKPEPDALRKLLYSKLGLPEPRPPAQESTTGAYDRGPWTGLFLTDVEIKVDVVPDARRLVTVKTSFDVPYGDDAALDVFSQGKDDRWYSVLHFTSRPYARIDGAFTGFDYRLSPPDERGKWFAVATYINPWPSSCWQTLSVEVLQPDFYMIETEGKDLSYPSQGDNIFHKTEGGYVCDDVPPYLRSITKDGFEIRFSIPSIDESILSSVSEMSYRVDDGEITRVQPMALNAVNFADEWVRRKWEEAQGWSGVADRESLHRGHEALHRQVNGHFTSLRSCTDSSEQEVDFATNGEGSTDGPTWYFLVKKSGQAYTMMRMSLKPSPGCNRADRLATIKDR